jgi:hypothetical protein
MLMACTLSITTPASLVLNETAMSWANKLIAKLVKIIKDK